ncbi:MAG: large subunit ribosomal protein L18 [Candidatus Paceibacteria bacterium]|jgi:large subunit ribosomal protein L18
MKTKGEIKDNKRLRIKNRIRAKISGTADKPRLSVFRSNKYIQAQLIDDVAQVTLAAASDLKDPKGTKTERAEKAGIEIAELAKTKGISEIVFDRNGFKYAGRIKALADKAREGGLKF